MSGIFDVDLNIMPSAIQLKPRIQRFSNPSWHCALLNVFKDLNKGLIPFQRDETTFKRAKFEGPSRLKLIKFCLIQICLCEGKYLVLFHDGGFIVKKKQKTFFETDKIETRTKQNKSSNNYRLFTYLPKNLLCSESFKESMILAGKLSKLRLVVGSLLS